MSRPEHRRRAAAPALALLRVAALLGIVASAAACGTTCDDASTICGFETVETSTDCTGATECASLCIVDWDACDVNNADAPESKCIAQCLAQAEES